MIVESFTSPYNQLVNLIKTTTGKGRGLVLVPHELVLLYDYRSSSGCCMCIMSNRRKASRRRR